MSACSHMQEPFRPAHTHQVSIEILSPEQGSTIDASDPKGLPLHIKVHGMIIPTEGYAQVCTIMCVFDVLLGFVCTSE